MGSTADELSSLTMQEAEKEMIEFDEPLKDYLRTIYAVKLALQRRHERRLTYTTCLSEVTVKRMNYAKFRATPGAEAKAYGAERSLKRGEIAADAARDEFATVSQRVLREVDRFKREKGEQMRLVVLDYITAQIEYNKKMEELWAGLLPQLETLTVNTSGSGSNSNSGSSNGNGIDGAGAGTEHSNSQKEDGDNVPPSLTEPSPDIEGEVEDMAQPMPQPPNNHSHIYQGGLPHHQNMVGLEGSIQYRDVNAYPGYSNMCST